MRIGSAPVRVRCLYPLVNLRKCRYLKFSARLSPEVQDLFLNYGYVLLENEKAMKKQVQTPPSAEPEPVEESGTGTHN